VGVQAEASTFPLVFVHGVGGMCFYYGLLEELTQETDGSIVLLDLPFVSLRIADEIPSVNNQIQSIEAILDEKFGPGSKVSFAGHSYGSIVLSWMVQAKSERVANCIFIGEALAFANNQKIKSIPSICH
jgi:pimeloyl-ACP methyl ester carboxylesterase